MPALAGAAEVLMSATVVRAKCSPMIFIPAPDHERLCRLASVAGLAGSPVAEFLASELDRAIVRPADEIAANIVTMNARVAFRIGARRAIEIRTLVYPDEDDRRPSGDDCLSVMTPLGAALIGLRVGTGMAYETLESTLQHVTVEAVIHQPEAAGHRWSPGPRSAPRPWADDDPGPSAA
jgi:regulator of nucleoside diphosphate kinase